MGVWWSAVILLGLSIACGCSSSEPAPVAPAVKGCVSDSDCDRGLLCTEQHECVQCRFDSQCADTQRCDNGQCLTRVSCASTADCPSAAAKACDTQLGECFECVSASDCGAGKACNHSHQCVEARTCGSSSACPAGKSVAPGPARTVARIRTAAPLSVVPNTDVPRLAARILTAQPRAYCAIQSARLVSNAWSRAIVRAATIVMQAAVCVMCVNPVTSSVLRTRPRPPSARPKGIGSSACSARKDKCARTRPTGWAASTGNAHLVSANAVQTAYASNDARSMACPRASCRTAARSRCVSTQSARRSTARRTLLSAEHRQCTDVAPTALRSAASNSASAPLSAIKKRLPACRKSALPGKRAARAGEANMGRARSTVAATRT
jgi:hypothetical protein